MKLRPDRTRWTRPRRPPAITRAVFLAPLLVTVLVAAMAGCGGSSGTASNAQASGQSTQVMYTVKRGDLVKSVMARVQVTATGSKAEGTAIITKANATSVAKGQSVTLSFFSASQQGQSPGSLPSQSGSPAPVQGSPSPGQGSAPGSGQGVPGGKQAKGTVTSVKANSDGSVTATISITKLPSSVAKGATGMASISLGVVAKDVLLVPTAAIKGSGSSATVQMLVNGKTQTQSVTVGKRTQMQAEITSGLSEGDNVIYTSTFRGNFGGGQGGASGAPPGGGTPPSGYPAANGAPAE
jgi:hypothetical protein